ncbi:unnamed protein product [Cochlearia groenlandica]
MAKTEKRNREKNRSSSSSFLGCFGFSRKIYSEKTKIVEEDGGGNKKKQTRWFLCSKFHMKKREMNKTVPIEETEKKHTFSIVEVETDKRNPCPLIRRFTDHNNTKAHDDKTANRDTKETKPKVVRDITLFRPKPMARLVSLKEDTCMENIYHTTRMGEPNSKQTRVRNGSRVKKYDPVIGISIVTVTLVIMLIWGRLCAILCTSAWCYSLPRLRDAAASTNRKTQRGRRFYV